MNGKEKPIQEKSIDERERENPKGGTQCEQLQLEPASESTENSSHRMPACVHACMLDV